MNNEFINFIALASLVFYPSIPIVLIVAHGFISFWRKIGKASYVIFAILFLFLDFAAFRVVSRFNGKITSWRLYDSPLALAGIFVILFGVLLGFFSIRALSFWALMGVPEIIYPESGKLVISGVYGFIRHPRYLEFILEMTGIAILSGLALNFLMLISFVPLMYLAAYVEESELTLRFGEEFQEYKKRIGGFLPKNKFPKR